MKPLLTILLLALLAATAVALPRADGLFVLSADPEGISCSATVPAFTPLELYVVILDEPCVQTVRFRIDSPAGPTMPTWLNDHIPGQIILWGDSQTGAIVVLPPWLEPPYYVMKVTYLTLAPVESCTEFLPAPHPDAGYDELLIEDCDVVTHAIDGRGFMLNPTPDCDECGEMTIPTEGRTWGAVKGIYGN